MPVLSSGSGYSHVDDADLGNQPAVAARHRPRPGGRSVPGHRGGSVTGHQGEPPGYTWNLRALMATRQLWRASQLTPLLNERGITISASQTRRVVYGVPYRLSLPLLAALCDILDCGPSDLIAITPRG